MRKMSNLQKHMFFVTLLLGDLFRPHTLGPKEIDGLLVPSGKAYTLLADHLITG